MSLKAQLVRIDDFGVEPDGERQQITIDDVTHLGRSSRKTPRTDRVRAEMFEDVKVAIKIEDEHTFVSRNHALIHPPDDERGDFMITDLYSLNGTFVNGEKIPPNKRMPLRRDDELSLAYEGARFTFRILPSSEHDTNFGLMVGHWGFNLHGTTHDVLDLKRELEMRGFQGNIETLFDMNATRANIRRRLEVLERYLTKDSTFLFYFSGHGGKDGELSLGRESMAAEELLRMLGNFRGQILMILDGCYTEALATHALFPHHAALIGHEGKAYEGRTPSVLVGQEQPLRREDQIRGYTTRAICKILQADPHRIDVNALVAKVRNDPRLAVKQRVTIHDTTRIELASQTSRTDRRSK